MIQSLYTGMTGMMSYQRAMDVTGNNAANIGVAGFKGSRTTFHSLFESNLEPGYPLKSLGLGAWLNSIDRDMSPGLIEETGLFSDLAITGRGFFSLGTYALDPATGLPYLSARALTRVGKFDVMEDMRMVQGNGGQFILGLNSTVSGGVINPPTLPDEKTVLGWSDAQRADFYNSLEAIDLSAFRTMQPHATQTLSTRGFLNSACGPKAFSFEDSDPAQTENFSFRMRFSRSTENYGTLFQDDRQYNWTIEGIDGSTAAVTGTVASGTITFDPTGNVVGVNGGTGNLIQFEMGGIPFELDGDTITRNCDFETPSSSAWGAIFDGDGNEIDVGLKFEKVDSSRWVFRPYTDSGLVSGFSLVTDAGSDFPMDGNIVGYLEFDADGNPLDPKLLDLTSGDILSEIPRKLRATLAGGQTLDMDLELQSQASAGNTPSWIKEVAANFDLSLNQIGGWPFGSLESLEFDNDGSLYGGFSNGQRAILAKIPLVQIRFPESLRAVEAEPGTYLFDPVYESNNFTGVFIPGQGGTGPVKPYALEYSNVDLAREMTNMILYQRSIQLNARTIQTADAILQEVAGLKR